MKIAVIVFLSLGVCTLGTPGPTDEFIIPDAISSCVKASGKLVEIRNDINPFYLRGDFLASGKPAIAVAIRRNDPIDVGVLLCPATGKPIMFMPGQKGEFVSRDVTDPNFVAPHWEVYTNEQARDILQQNHRPAVIKGEAIAMMWEDGIGLLFYDGHHFRWVGAMQ